jgi:hypothetical protein
MRTLDENTALAILFSNIRRKKRNTDLITIARACKYLTDLYGSQKAVAEKIGLSTEMIREFLTTLKLPVEIKKLISERKIDSVDVVREISAIREPSKQIIAAHAFANSPSKDVRDIKRLIKDANFSIEDAKKTVLNAKPKGLHIFVVDFDEDIYQAITRQAKAMKIRPPELVREIVKDWLRRKTTIHKERKLQ